MRLRFSCLITIGALWLRLSVLYIVLSIVFPIINGIGAIAASATQIIYWSPYFSSIDLAICLIILNRIILFGFKHMDY